MRLRGAGADVVASLDDGHSWAMRARCSSSAAASCLPKRCRADRLLLTEIDADFDGDTHAGARSSAMARDPPRGSPATTERPFDYSFVVYER